MIALGFIFLYFAKKQGYKHMGQAILGFGILFFGMKIMSDAMVPLRTFAPFISLLEVLENPFLGIFIGLLFTALIQRDQEDRLRSTSCLKPGSSGSTLEGQC